jgi:seryl-tRNA synthetase
LLQRNFNDTSQLVPKEKDQVKRAELVQKGKDLKSQIPLLKENESKSLQKRDELLYSIANLVHDAVPVSLDTKNNNVLLHSFSESGPHLFVGFEHMEQ